MDSSTVKRYEAWKAHRFEEADLAEEMASIEDKEEETNDDYSWSIREEEDDTSNEKEDSAEEES